MTLVYVAGMHRSGTSATARVINLLGLSVGPPEGLIPAGPNNAKGYWEQVRVSQLNDRILAALGGSWNRPPRMPEGWARSAAAQELIVEVSALLSDLRSVDDPGYVVKDPRFSITLPVWEQASAAAGVVVPVRDPREVCQSMARRNGMPTRRSAALWLRYVKGALSNASSPLVILYSDLLTRPLPLAARLSAELGLEPPSAATSEAIVEFVDGRLNHAESFQHVKDCRPLSRALKLYDRAASGDLAKARSMIVTDN